MTIITIISFEDSSWFEMFVNQINFFFEKRAPGHFSSVLVDFVPSPQDKTEHHPKIAESQCIVPQSQTCTAPHWIFLISPCTV